MYPYLTSDEVEVDKKDRLNSTRVAIIIAITWSRQSLMRLPCSQQSDSDSVIVNNCRSLRLYRHPALIWHRRVATALLYLHAHFSYSVGERHAFNFSLATIAQLQT